MVPDIAQPHFPENPLIDAYMAELQKTTFFQGGNIDGSFAFNLKYYRARAPRMMTRYRFLGVLVIVLSAAIPAISAFADQIPGHTIWLSLMAVFIAAATGINAFFRWDNNWQGFINAKLGLEEAWNRWQIAIVDARSEPDCQKGLEMAQNATGEFINRSNLIIEAETKGYFSAQRSPIKAESGNP